MRRWSWLAVALLLTAASARAGDVPTPANGESKKSDLDFDLLGAAPAPRDHAERDAAFEKRVRRRRTMLQWHTALGFVTLAGLLATNILGTLEYVDKYGGGNDTGRYYSAHEWLSVATTGLFATTGALALFAPNPYPKPLRFDAALVHKLSMALATACFAAEIVLGPVAAAREGHLDQRQYALAHVVLGWGAFAFMGAGTLAFVFK
jgi:hypothetical protein